jgi:hypothetical protein
MANLPGEDYSSTSLGCVYLVPVHPHITTQDDFFKVHVSRHNKKKELIDGRDYEKGKHQNPQLRKPSKPSKQQGACRDLPAVLVSRYCVFRQGACLTPFGRNKAARAAAY